MAARTYLVGVSVGGGVRGKGVTVHIFGILFYRLLQVSVKDEGKVF